MIQEKKEKNLNFLNTFPSFFFLLLVSFSPVVGGIIFPLEISFNDGSRWKRTSEPAFSVPPCPGVIQVRVGWNKKKVLRASGQLEENEIKAHVWTSVSCFSGTDRPTVTFVWYFALQEETVVCLVVPGLKVFACIDWHPIVNFWFGPTFNGWGEGRERKKDCVSVTQMSPSCQILPQNGEADTIQAVQ